MLRKRGEKAMYRRLYSSFMQQLRMLHSKKARMGMSVLAMSEMKTIAHNLALLAVWDKRKA